MKELSFYNDELFAAMVYEELAKAEKDEEFRSKLTLLSEMERGHALFWRRILTKKGIEPSERISKTKVLLIGFLRRLFGAALTIRLLEATETSAIERYLKVCKEWMCTEEERKTLRAMIVDELEHEILFKAENEKRGWITHVRDMVLGMNDGLVEVLAAVAGLAGVYSNPLWSPLEG